MRPRQQGYDGSTRSPAPRPDRDIKADVHENLRNAASIGRHIAVAVNGGVVTLSGDIGSLPARLAAKRAAGQVAGVTAVRDDMQVHILGAGDADIAHAAGQALSGAADVPVGAVTAQVRHQVITLSGSVAADHQRVAAARAVRHITGVTGVANVIAVRGG